MKPWVKVEILDEDLKRLRPSLRRRVHHNWSVEEGPFMYVLVSRKQALDLLAQLEAP